MDDVNTENTCCVCGTPTDRRCSACGAIGLDILFCSEEHQELVWWAHKLACGSGSKTVPFRFARLLPSEVALLRSSCQAREVKRIERDLELCLPGAAGEWGVMSVLKALSNPASLKSYSASRRAAALYHIRPIVDALQQDDQDNFLRRHVAQTQRNLAQVFVDSGVEGWQYKSDPALAFPVHDPIYALLHHRVLVAEALDESAATRPPAGVKQEATQEMVEHARQQAIRLQWRLQSAYPAAVERLLRWFELNLHLPPAPLFPNAGTEQENKMSEWIDEVVAGSL